MNQKVALSKATAAIVFHFIFHNNLDLNYYLFFMAHA